jgi:hypothetical protein
VWPQRVSGPCRLRGHGEQITVVAAVGRRLRAAVVVCVVSGPGSLAACAVHAARPAARPALSPIRPASSPRPRAGCSPCRRAPRTAAGHCGCERRPTAAGTGSRSSPARVSSWPTVIFGDGPPEIPPGAVNSVLFASRLDGRAYGPGLWATHDGGPARTCCGSTGISTPRAQPHPGAVVALLGAGPGHRQGVGPVSDRQCP